MTNCNARLLWLFGVLLPAVGFAQVVQSVSVSQERGQTLITISGERLSRPTVNVWRRQFLVMDFRARLRGRGYGRTLRTPHALKLRYGWFSSRPPKVRVVITMRGTQPYTVEQTPTGWQVRLGKPQASDIASETPPPLEPIPEPRQNLVASTQTVPSRTHAPEPNQPRTVAAAAPPAPSRILISLDFVNAEIGDVLKALAIQSGANIITAPDVKGTVTVSLSRLTVEESLNLITRLSGYRYEKIDNTYVVGTEASLKAFRPEEPPKPPEPPKPRAVEALTFKVAKPSDIANYLSARFPELKITPSNEKDAT
ncbi:MAG: STN domain-containing protein, partial [Fimbriimonadales bacterium]|nr:STN domain-containing protein [Fimbriimonadales bacterium]